MTMSTLMRGSHTSDIEGAAIGRYFPVEIAVQADARQTALALMDATRGDWSDWLARFETDKAALAQERANEAAMNTTPMHPRRALAEIRAALPKNAIVSLATGNACLQSADRLAHYQTPGLITPLDFGLVGFGYAAALGAQGRCAGSPSHLYHG